jgi:maleate isomerase
MSRDGELGNGESAKGESGSGASGKTARSYRIGQIVPSSNTTMETELPAMFHARQAAAAERFTFHSSRMRMHRVTREELAAMDADSGRCALELSDARVDILGYACLVAIMSNGHGYHRISERRLEEIVAANGSKAPVVTSAGALIHGIKALGAKKIAIITPYLKPLTDLVIGYIEQEGIEVHDSISLEIADNLEVGSRDALAPVELSKKLDTRGVDVIVASACVQMPSLASIEMIQQRSGLPVISAAVCTAFQMLQRLHLTPIIPGAGALLSGRCGVEPGAAD